MLININGAQLSSQPTPIHIQLLHIRINQHLTQTLSYAQNQPLNPKDQFQLTQDKLHIKAYVDPSELSYHSFENILQMDDCFFESRINHHQKLNLTVDPVKKVGNHFMFKLVDHDNMLMNLHHMELYTLPFNNMSRGGKRMIFSSLKLADTIYTELKERFRQALNEEHQKYDFELLSNDFNSINHVFRLNSFSPECKNFKSHYDTPFSDNQRKLYSKFTLIIYLTGGTNPTNGCLRIQDQVIHEIPAFTGVIFDQRYQHEGWPYIENDKVFLRTELVYFVKDLENDSRVAEMFNKACYFQKQAYVDHQNDDFSNQLQKYSNDLFNHTAKLRYYLAQKADQMSSSSNTQTLMNHEEMCHFNTINSKYLLKKLYDQTYITDGNSFWFLDETDVKLGAKIVLVDYFNGKMKLLSSKPSDSHIQTKIISKPINVKYIKSHENSSSSQIYSTDSQILEFLRQIILQFPKQPQQNPFDFQKVLESGREQFQVNEIYCGISRDCRTFTSTQGQQQARYEPLKRLKAKMDGIGVVLFENRVYVNDEQIKIYAQKGYITFNNAILNRTINFASCQCQRLRLASYIFKQHVQIEGFMLPKMRYQKLPQLQGYKLSIDMFKNGFIHRAKVTVSRPYAQMFDRKKEYLDFFDQDEEYIDSDSDFNQEGGKRGTCNVGQDAIDEEEGMDYIQKKVRK